MHNIQFNAPENFDFVSCSVETPRQVYRGTWSTSQAVFFSITSRPTIQLSALVCPALYTASMFPRGFLLLD